MYDLKEKDNLTIQVDKEFDAIKRKQKMKLYDDKLEQLADTIEYFTEKHGQDYFMVEILTMFLDVSIKMKEVMEMMSSMNMVMELFGDAVNFIDESMSLQDTILESTLDVKYGFFSRIKNYFHTRKIIKNNVRRIDAICRNIYTKYQMAMGMVKTLQGLSGTLKKSMSKMSGKKKSSGASVSQYSSATQFLNERRAAKNGDAVSTPAPQPSASSSDSSVSSGGAINLSGI
jgi:hypothetical protein